MRRDMKDVIIEAERHEYDWPGSRGAAKQRDIESLPEREGMRKRHPGYGPIPGDRLNPLVRYLRSNTGRPWDKVYSELCENADARSLRGWHFREHVWMEVDTYEEYLAKSESRRCPYPARFHIDAHGFLRESKERLRRHWRYKREPKPTIRIDDNLYEQVNGCWFQVWYEKREVPERYYDLMTYTYKYRTGHEEYKARQRQLSKKELKKLGLRNE